jgi:hypothetical protein
MWELIGQARWQRRADLLIEQKEAIARTDSSVREQVRRSRETIDGSRELLMRLDQALAGHAESH